MAVGSGVNWAFVTDLGVDFFELLGITKCFRKWGTDSRGHLRCHRPLERWLLVLLVCCFEGSTAASLQWCAQILSEGTKGLRGVDIGGLLGSFMEADGKEWSLDGFFLSVLCTMTGYWYSHFQSTQLLFLLLLHVLLKEICRGMARQCWSIC